MQLNDFREGQKVRATGIVVNNLDMVFSPGTVFLVNEVYLGSCRAGPCLEAIVDSAGVEVPGYSLDGAPVWYYWEEADGIPGCKGLFEVVE